MTIGFKCQMISKAFDLVEFHYCSLCSVSLPVLSSSDAKVWPHRLSSVTQSVLYLVVPLVDAFPIMLRGEARILLLHWREPVNVEFGLKTPNELSACSIQCFFDTFCLVNEKADHTLISNGEQNHLLYFMPYSLFVMNIYICWSLLRCIKIPH